MSTALPNSQIYRRCAVLCLTLLTLLLAGYVTNGDGFLTRDLWMDEVHSWLLISDPDPVHAMHALADGVDFNPPAWFLLTNRLFHTIPDSSPTTLRLLSLFWILCSLGILFWIHTRYLSESASATAVILTASHPLVIHHAFEIRFYSFWAMLITMVSGLLMWQPVQRSTQFFRHLLIIAAAVLTTATHYLAVLSLMLVCGAAVLPVSGRRGRIGAVFSIAITSLFVLTICRPFLQGQQQSLSHPTWISPPTIGDSLLFLQAMLPSWQILSCLLAAALSWKLFTSSEDSVRDGAKYVTALLPCLILTLMPVVIVAFSWIVQPALVTRYAFVGLLGLTSLYALLLQACRPQVRRMMLAASILFLMSGIHSHQNQWNSEQVHLRNVQKSLSQLPENSLVVFEDRIAGMPIIYKGVASHLRCRLADFADHELRENSRLRIVQRDVARTVRKWYPQYATITPHELSTLQEFHLVPYEGETKTGLLFPAEFRTSQTMDSVLTLERVKVDAGKLSLNARDIHSTWNNLPWHRPGASRVWVGEFQHP